MQNTTFTDLSWCKNASDWRWSLFEKYFSHLEPYSTTTTLKTLKRRFLHSTFQCSVKVELFLCPWNFFYFLTVTLSSEGWKLVKATLKKNNRFTSPLKQKRSNFPLLFQSSEISFNHGLQKTFLPTDKKVWIVDSLVQSKTWKGKTYQSLFNFASSQILFVFQITLQLVFCLLSKWEEEQAICTTLLLT